MSNTLSNDDYDEDDFEEGAITTPRSGIQPSIIEVTPLDDDDEDPEIVETDDNFRPVQGRRDGSEARLTEAEVAEKPLLEQQGTEERKQRRDRAEERRRRREGRQRTFAELAETKAELALLKQQIEGIAPRLSQLDQQRIVDQIANTDREIQGAAAAAAAARRKMAEAVASADAEAMTDALEARDIAVQRGQELAAQKARLSAVVPERVEDTRGVQPNNQQNQRQQSRPAPLPTAAVGYVEDFRAKHNWMKMTPDGRPADLDTEMMLRIDASVAGDGYDPTTQDYWDEIEDRGRRYLGHRFSAQQQQPARNQNPRQPPQNEPRRGPMTTGGADSSARPVNRNQVYLSPGRKEALITLGALDKNGKTVIDKDTYRKYIRAYQEYDRENNVNA